MMRKIQSVMIDSDIQELTVQYVARLPGPNLRMEIGGKCESVMGRRVVRKGVSKRVFERRSYQLVAS